MREQEEEGVREEEGEGVSQVGSGQCGFCVAPYRAVRESRP